MATSSSSSSSSNLNSRCAYDVFLSFRGEDTRRGFSDHLYAALVREKLRTFRDDDEIDRGEKIGPELRKSIRESKISIVVFSRGYASSSWCLDELMVILESRRSLGRRVLPVFYDVDPSEVRRQNGSFAAAFREYEKKVKAEKDEDGRIRWREKVDEWKIALSEAADLPGMELRNQADGGYESKFIQKIVEVIRDKLDRPVLSIDSFLVGVHPRARNIMKWLQDKSIDVGVIGICGMGGIGKTTITKLIYNMNFTRFEASCFLANVREVSEQPNGLQQLQRQLLSDILKRNVDEIYNLDDGITKIKNGVRYKRVLLVLDDVDQIKQLEAILGMRTYFHPGSRIIIITRFKQLLKASQIDEIHEVRNLEEDESFMLFSWHAFGQYHPPGVYQECSKKIVKHCNGLPLALRVLGSSLFGKTLEVWESALRKLQAFPQGQVHQKLTISYDSLEDEHDKKLFLYIACFFVGKDRDFVVTVLDGCDFYTKIGIENLIDRNLLTVDEQKNLQMHQLLHDMGKEINRKQSPEPGKRIIVWRHVDSYNVLREKSGTATIEGLALDMRMFEKNKSIMKFSSNVDLIETNAFAKMHKLRILRLVNVQPTGCYKGFPNKLRWMSWHGFHLSSLPNDFPLESLVALEMPYSRLEHIWKGNKFLGALKILNMSHSHGLMRTPTFTGLPNLERLILKECVGLVLIHESIVDVKGLVFLDLKNCRNLRNLPRDIGKLKYMETLIISGCSSLEEMPIELSQMECLKAFDADGVTINQLVSGNNGVKLKPWHAYVLACVSSIPRRIPQSSSVSLPRSLVRLSLKNCNLPNDVFPNYLCNLSSLQDLNLSENPLCSLPDFVKGLCGLKKLNLRSCTMIQLLLGVPTTVRELSVGECTSLETISFQSTSLRSSMEITSCGELVEIEGSYKLKPIEEADVQIINNFGLDNLEPLTNTTVKFRGFRGSKTKKLSSQGLHEFGIFSIFLPDIEFPCSLSIRCEGSSLSFTVPSSSNLKVQGLNTCTLYALSGKEQIWTPPLFYCTIMNKTKNLVWAYSPMFLAIPETIGQNMALLSYWNFGDQLEPGDELDVSLAVDDDLQLKEFGVEFVCFPHGKEWAAELRNSPFGWEQALGGDLSDNEFTTGVFLLDNGNISRFRTEGEEKIAGNWLEIVFGDFMYRL